MKPNLSPKAVGIAGELRVMSELMFRGFNPAKGYLDNGIDIILDNGKKIQVKTTIAQSENHRAKTYKVGLHKRNKNTHKGIADEVDFLIIFIPPQDRFYIIPSKEIGSTWGLNVSVKEKSKKSKLNKYIGNWDLLKE